MYNTEGGDIYHIGEDKFSRVDGSYVDTVVVGDRELVDVATGIDELCTGHSEPEADAVERIAGACEVGSVPGV